MFTLAEWLTILAAIRFAGLKTQSLPLYSISMLLQWALFFYLVAQRSHWARRYVRPLRDRKWLFWSVGVLVSAGITVAANWLVEDTVSRLVQAAAGP